MPDHGDFEHKIQGCSVLDDEAAPSPPKKARVSPSHIAPPKPAPSPRASNPTSTSFSTSPAVKNSRRLSGSQMLARPLLIGADTTPPRWGVAF